MQTVPSHIREPLRAALQARTAKLLVDETAVPSSVLVPLVDRGGQAHVWLTRRPETMSRHRGQVAFPGGKRDPSDESPLATALRETREEMGFDENAIEILGGLDEMVTTTGYRISPFVGWLREDVTPTTSPREIARAFCPPLASFVHTEPKARFWRGKGITRIAPSYEVDGELVWGATARIMRGLVEVVRAVMDRHGMRV